MEEQLGCYLKTQRELRQVDIRAVSDETKIAVNWLRVIEADDWDKLPGKTFARGYAKAYAQALGLDVDDVVSRYDHMNFINDKVDVGNDIVKIAKRRGGGLRKFFPLIIVASAIIVAIILWVVL